MNKEKIEIVQFADNTYAIRKTNKYGTPSFLDTSDLTYWWSKDHIKHAKTTDLHKLEGIVAKATTPEEISLGTPISKLKVKVGTKEPIVTESTNGWDTSRSPVTKAKRAFKSMFSKMPKIKL